MLTWLRTNSRRPPRRPPPRHLRRCRRSAHRSSRWRARRSSALRRPSTRRRSSSRRSRPTAPTPMPVGRCAHRSNVAPCTATSGLPTGSRSSPRRVTRPASARRGSRATRGDRRADRVASRRVRCGDRERRECRSDIGAPNSCGRVDQTREIASARGGAPQPLHGLLDRRQDRTSEPPIIRGDLRDPTVGEVTIGPSARRAVIFRSMSRTHGPWGRDPK